MMTAWKLPESCLTIKIDHKTRSVNFDMVFWGYQFPPKNQRTNSTLLLWYLRSTCFRFFLGRNWRHQKDFSKLTDLYAELIVKNLEASWLLGPLSFTFKTELEGFICTFSLLISLSFLFFEYNSYVYTSFYHTFDFCFFQVCLTNFYSLAHGQA